HLYFLFIFIGLANPSPQCDLANGWMTYGSNCYKFKSDTRKSWTSARHDCVADGADLVSITSAGENQFVTANMGETHLDLWIGLSTLVRELAWSDATQDFLPWAEHQPDNWQNNEDCMHITGTTHNDPGKLNDDFCTATRDYICKKGVINAFIFASF
uniref:C-type lectin domain-containing protein n=1 Tax=Neolamprologus brichardi TaxID=32507 RepID=A0A3Q4HA49_NEOBR